MNERYWAAVSNIASALVLCGTAFLFCRLIQPFLRKKKPVFLVGVVYSLSMFGFYFIPWQMGDMAALMAAFAVMYAIDHRNREQKVFLCCMMFLLIWISHGISIFLRDIGIMLLDLIPSEGRDDIQFGIFVVMEIMYASLRFFILNLLVHIVRHIYVWKQENMSKKELVLMLSTPLSVIAGYCAFQFFSEIYLTETDQYIWREHGEYWWIKVIYQLVSFVAVILSLMMYQRIKSIHKKEKEDAVLQEQIENMKNHIAEVEAHYLEIRRLKHDMGNHMMILENLVLKNQTQGAEDYLVRLKGELRELEVKGGSGNPVVDVILDEGRKKAGECGICFVADFHFPADSPVNVFDLSVILNNAITNAIEGSRGIKGAVIELISYREKNAYIIECRNHFAGTLCPDEESGLPVTTKENRQEHGYGLINIRKVAQKYKGDVDIRQEDGNFILSVMLMMG